MLYHSLSENKRKQIFPSITCSFPFSALSLPFIFQMTCNLKRHCLHSCPFHVFLVPSGTDRHYIYLRVSKSTDTLQSSFDLITFSPLNHSLLLAFGIPDKTLFLLLCLRELFCFLSSFIKLLNQITCTYAQTFKTTLHLIPRKFVYLPDF